MAQKDPFEIGKVDGVGSGGSAGGISPSYIPGGAANRVGDAGAAGGATGTPAVPATGVTDKVHLSNDVGDADDDNTVKDQNMASLLSALKPPDAANSVQKVNPATETAAIQGTGGQSNYDPGMQAGAVYGPNGAQGVQPGMQAGAVHSSRPQGG